MADLRNRILGVNIPVGERVVSAIAGAAALVASVRRRAPARVAIAVAGGALVIRAITGRSPIYRARAIRKGIAVRRSVTIQRPAREIYAFVRGLPRLAGVLEHVDAITVDDSGVSTWIVEDPIRLVWRVQIVDDVPGRRLRWRSLPGGDVACEGAIELREAPADRGTVVEVKLHYLPPGGLIVASALYEFLRRLTTMQLAHELARLQQLLETGEIAVTGVR